MRDDNRKVFCPKNLFVYSPNQERQATMAIRKRLDNLVRARKALSPLWAKADLKGRCWGSKGAASGPYRGSAIVLADCCSLVVLSLDREGTVEIREFAPYGGRQLSVPLMDKITVALSHESIPFRVERFRE